MCGWPRRSGQCLVLTTPHTSSFETPASCPSYLACPGEPSFQVSTRPCTSNHVHPQARPQHAPVHPHAPSATPARLALKASPPHTATPPWSQCAYTNVTIYGGRARSPRHATLSGAPGPASPAAAESRRSKSIKAARDVPRSNVDGPKTHRVGRVAATHLTTTPHPLHIAPGAALGNGNTRSSRIVPARSNHRSSRFPMFRSGIPTQGVIIVKAQPVLQSASELKWVVLDGMHLDRASQRVASGNGA